MSDPLPTVIGLGEVLWDVFPDSKRPGGAPANVAWQVNQMGSHGLVMSAVGDDQAGRELRAQLQHKGLDVSLVRRDRDHPTGRVTVDLSDEAHPDYTIHQNVAWDFLKADEDWLAAAAHASAVAFGTLAQRCTQSREAIHEVLRACSDECLIVYDINLRQSWYDAEWIDQSLQAADMLKLNRDEVTVIGRLLGIDAADLADCAGAVLERFKGLKLVCVTRAEEGCLLVTDDETVDLPGTPIDVVDGVGAGDAFTAALITARLNEWPLEATAKFANAVGGLVTSHAGAMPDLRQELAELHQTYAP